MAAMRQPSLNGVADARTPQMVGPSSVDSYTPPPKGDYRDAMFNEISKGSPDPVLRGVSALAGSGDIGKAVVNAGVHAVDATPAGWLPNLVAPNTVQSVRDMTKPQDEELANAADAYGSGLGLVAAYAMGKAGADGLSKGYDRYAGRQLRESMANRAIQEGYVSEDPAVNAAIQKYSTINK